MSDQLTFGHRYIWWTNEQTDRVDEQTNKMVLNSSPQIIYLSSDFDYEVSKYVYAWSIKRT